MKKIKRDVLSLDNSELLNDQLLSPNLANLLKAKLNGQLIPDGFIISSSVYFEFLNLNFLSRKITDLISTIHYDRPDSVMQVSNHIQKLILSMKFSEEFINAVEREYKKMSGIFKPAEVIVGENGKTAKNIKEVLKEIKSIWISRFEPNRLLFNHQHLVDNLSDGIAIPVFKKINSGKKGELFTKNGEIKTSARLNPSEFKSLSTLSTKLREHFYLPLIASWLIDKDKLFVVRLIPMTNAKESTLVLIRHGESEWNAKGLWTGWSDPSLSELGIEQAREAGKKLQEIHFDAAYTSALLRAIQTLNEIKKAKKQPKIPTISNKALNERDYGALTGKNKWEIQKEFGDEQFLKWRRGWDEPIPQGESLKDVYARVIPYYKDKILPQLKSGKNVIIAAHGNSLRALVKYLEGLTDIEVTKLEIPVGQIHLYKIDEDGKIVSKEIRN